MGEPVLRLASTPHGREYEGMDEAAVVLITPDHVPDELGGSYTDALRALDLRDSAAGYVLYLLDVMHLRSTLVSTHTQPVSEALVDLGPGTGLVCDVATAAAAVQRGSVVEARRGWPEEFGGGPRCQFCRDPEPARVYEGAAVEVLLGEPLREVFPPPVLGTEITGCIEWFACERCRPLIDARTHGAWRQLLDRYDGGEHVPMPVQAAWREF